MTARAQNSCADVQHGQCIENSIIRFVDILRHLGLRVSSAEVIDVVRALEMVGMAERKQVEAVFAATLAKDEAGQKIVRRAFNSYFTTAEMAKERTEQYIEAQEKQAKELQVAEQELTFQWEQWGEDGANSGEVKLELTDEEKQVYARLPEDKKEKIRDYLKNQFQANRINNPEKLITNMIKSSLNYWKYKLRNEKVPLPFDIEYTGDPEKDSLLDQVLEQTRHEDDILYEDMQKLADRDLPQLGQIIHRLSRKLATRISRRYRRSKKKRRLDLRKSVRENIRYGGTLFNLDFKTKKVQKPRFLLICDVSGSMAKYASFVLQFIYGLSSAVDDIESFVFSENVERITSYLREGQAFENTMADLINKSEDWGKGTDLHKALLTIRQQYAALLRPDTFIIIVSDTKTQNYLSSAAELAAIRKGVKDMIWLNTMPKRDWASSPTVNAFCKTCMMYECNTLAHLEKIMTHRVFK